MIRSVLFFGTKCSFADLVFERLVSSGIKIVARVVPGHPGSQQAFQFITQQSITARRSSLPMASHLSTGLSEPFVSNTPTLIAHDHGAPELEQQLRAFDADIAVVCCYPRRLPMNLVKTAQCGGINLHPSLLPKYRGPEPLFWLYRHGERCTGVTIHRVDSGLDTGPILAQESIDVPIGMPGNELWMTSAEQSARLLIDLLSSDDALRETAGRSQGRDNGTYFSWPRERDLTLKPEEWEAWRLFHFARGVIPIGYSPRIDLGDSCAIITAAHSYFDESYGEEPVDSGIRCRDGVVDLELKRDQDRTR
jgi:methionyl-tRNA formyltransferase